jgi:hypothetical protein
MANQPAPVQLSVVPGPVTKREIENRFDASRRVWEAIANFKAQRADAKAQLVRSLARISLRRPSTLGVRSNSAKPRRQETMLAARIGIAEQVLAIK